MRENVVNCTIFESDNLDILRGFSSASVEFEVFPTTFVRQIDVPPDRY